MTPPKIPDPSLVTLGKQLVKLGTAMQKPRTNLTELSALAWDCGLVFEFRLTPKAGPPPEQSSSEGKSG